MMIKIFQTNNRIISFVIILILSSILLANSIVCADGNIIYVDWDAAGTQDGSSWMDAYTDLQDALAAAVAGDQVWVAVGIYKPTTGTDRTATFSLESGVAIYGGFSGTETSLTERDWETNLTTLSGDIGTEDNNTDNSFHVVTGSGVDTTAVLDGFTITAGNADGADPNDRGGGMVNNNSNPTLSNIIFLDNRTLSSGAGSGGGMSNSYSSPILTNITFQSNSARYGGGMFNKESHPELSEVDFSGNKAAAYGGGMYNSYNSSPTLTTVTFSDNIAIDGGGMGNSSSSPTLTNVTFSSNIANHAGGGMHNYTNSSPILSNVTFSCNTAAVDGGGMYNFVRSHPILTNVNFSSNTADNGGGMYNIEYSSPTLTEVTFIENSAENGGGMYNYFYSRPNLSNVMFSINSAVYDGGGMYNKSNSVPNLNKVTIAGNSAENGGGIYNFANSNPILSNVTFSSNSAHDGGGMYNAFSSPTIMNVTFSANTATEYGGGIFNDNDSSSTIRSSIIWGNAPNQISGSATITYSDIEGGWEGNGNINEDPLLGPLAYNGGFTMTHALGEGSPTIDAGDPLSCPETDQRGVPRPIDGDGDDIAICDMGAYEYLPTVLIYLPLIVK